MIRTLLFWIISLIISSTVIGDPLNKDSLRSLMHNESVHDTIRLNAAYDLAVSYRTNNPDSAIWYAEWEYYYASQNQYQTQRARALNTIGIVLTYTDQLVRAEDYLQRANKMYLSLGDSATAARVNNNLGNLYIRSGNYLKALQQYQIALKVFEALQLSERAGIVLGNIGLIYMDIKYHEKALEYLYRSLKYAEESNNQNSQVYKLINIGIVLSEMNDHDRAVQSFQKADSLLTDNNLRLRGIIYENIAFCQIALGDTTRARRLLMEGIEMNKKVSNKKQLANCLVNLGKIVVHTNPDSALTMGTEALHLSQNAGILNEVSRAAELLYKTYKLLNKTPEALEMLELYETTQDSLNMEAAHKELIKQELQEQHEKEKLQQASVYDDQLKAEELARIRLITIGIILIILLAIGFTFLLRTRKANAKKQIEELSEEINQLREKNLTTQLSLKIDPKAVTLDKDNIEQAIQGKLNPSDWAILSALCEDPFIANKQLADQVSLSLEGTSSSLRKMYRLFKLGNTGNKKAVLVREAMKISMKLPSETV